MLSWFCGTHKSISVPSFDLDSRKSQLRMDATAKCSPSRSINSEINSCRYIKMPTNAWMETEDEIGTASECIKFNYPNRLEIALNIERGNQLHDIDDTYSCPTNRTNLKYCRTNSYSTSIDYDRRVDSKKTKFLDWLQMCLWKSSCGCQQLPTVNM